MVKHEIIGDDMQAVILSLAALRGPARVWLQTLPFSRLADRINGAPMSGSRREPEAESRKPRKPRAGSRKPVFGKMEFCRAGRRAWRDGGSSTAIDARQPRAGRR